MKSIDRRSFLASAATGSLVAASLGAPQVAGMTPIRRTGRPILKLSMAAYSFNGLLKSGKMDLAKFIDYCAELGLDGTELTSYYFPEKVTDDYLNSLKRQTHVAGLTISGGAIGNDGESLELTKTWIDHYADLGAPVIRVFAVKPTKGESEASKIKRSIATLERACDLAGKRGVMLALENHGGITARAETMLQIIKGVKSPWFGVNFDSGNFRDSDDPYAELARIAPYAINAQIKVEMKNNRTKKTTEADLSRVVGILRDADYSGWVVLEYERNDLDPFKGIPRYVDELRGILNAG